MHVYQGPDKIALLPDNHHAVSQAGRAVATSYREVTQAGVAVNEVLGEARRARKKPRLLKSQAVLAEAHAIKPAIPHQVRRQKGQPRRQPQQPARPSQAGAKPPATSSTYDLWEESGPAPDGQLALSDSLNLDSNNSGGNVIHRNQACSLWVCPRLCLAVWLHSWNDLGVSLRSHIS